MSSRTLFNLLAAFGRRRLALAATLLVFALFSGATLTRPSAQHRASSESAPGASRRLGGAVRDVGSGEAGGDAALTPPNEPQLTPTPEIRVITGVKWHDRNGNGRREPDEPGLPGWTIELTSARTKESRQTRTNAEGIFKFSQVAPGDYTVAEVRRKGWRQTFPRTPSHLVRLVERAVQIDFGNCPCDDDTALYDKKGRLILPSDADPNEPPTVENVDESTGHVGDLYGAYGDTSGDSWYDKFPCEQSIDDGSEPLPPLPDVDAEMSKLGVQTAQVTQKLNQLGPIIYNQMAAGQVFTFGKIADRAPMPQKPRPLNPSGPYSNRDIIYIHGLMPEGLWDRLTGANPQAYMRWPQHQSAFVGNGYWKSAANAYWREHIHDRLMASGGKNRYLVVAWPSTQRLNVAVHAVLTQIARAMGNGTEVVNPVNPNDVGGFCQANCVIVSHSTGALVADVAMTLAEQTKTSAVLNNQLGPLGFIPDHMKVHVALQGSFSGSHYATLAQAVALKIGSPDFCPLTTVIISSWAKGSLSVNPSICFQLANLTTSVLADLVPEVSQGLWGPFIQATPVPVITVAGGHPSKTLPLKNVFLRGFDDGVLAMNSQCANPTLSGVWPSGYIPVPSPLDVKVFDRGIATGRAVRYFLDQKFDKNFSFAPLPPNLMAVACTPFVSPTGMLQPVSGITANSLLRYNRHYSFIQSASDHIVGPVGSYSEGGCNNRNYLGTSNSANDEEVRVILNPIVYQPDTRFPGDPMPLVSSSMKTAVSERIEGKRFRIPLKLKKPRYLWIWKRIYHTLDGSDCLDEVDYVHQYVVR